MTPEMFRRLAALGLNHEQMAGVLEIFEEDASERKAKVKARVDKWRSKNKAETLRNVTERSETSQNVSERLMRDRDARGEDNLQTKNSTGQEENKKEAAPKALSDLAAFKADLEQDASAEQVEAFAKHRKTKKGQNSAYSAKLFRNDAAACGLSVSQAIDTAISRGWLTVKPEYLAGKNQPQQRATAPPRKPSAFDALDEISRMKGWTDEPASLSGNHENAERLPAVGGGPSGAVVDLRRGYDWHS